LRVSLRLVRPFSLPHCRLVTQTEVVLSWRMRAWSEGVTSRVTLSFAPKGSDSCTVTLLHEGIPDGDRYGSAQEPIVRAGWVERVFGGLKAMMGIGMEAEA